VKLEKLTVQAGEHERLQCPVETEIPIAQDVPCENLVLWDELDRKDVPVQAWKSEDGSVHLAWIVDRMDRHQTRAYELRALDKPFAPEGGVCLEEAPGRLEVTIGGNRFTTYNHDQVVRPYLYPVYADKGVGITRNWPMVEGLAGESTDHPHHKGIYTAQDEIRGVNNWGEGQGHGWQVHRAFSRIYSGPVAGGFTAEIDWTDQDRDVYMTESRRITFYRTSMQARLFDYQVTFHASKGDLVIGDTKEGGFISVRVASSMEEKRGGGGVIVNGCGGVREAETWGRRAQWCDYSGPIGGDCYGITLMDHPQNPRFPTYWHVRAYGLMTANCVGRHHFTNDPDNRWDMPIAAGESRTWRYRVLIHHGDVQAAQVPVYYEGFAYPPSVDIGDL
jgi:hypothetical protein